MLTYVINTSENKVLLKTDLLFDLVGYHKISWMRSSLSNIEDCANDIIKLQQPMTAGEYRVAVLVDFLAFEKTLYPEEYPVSEYISIYKSLIEIYLHDHLYAPLRRAQLGFDGLEVFYIQYTEKNTIRENAAEKEQLATLLGLDDEHKRITDEKKAFCVPEVVVNGEKKTKKSTEEKKEEKKLPLYERFSMEYEGGKLLFHADEFCKELDNEEQKSVTFDTFYRNYPEKYDIAYRAFGSRSRTYVAEAASARSESRAAFDNLNLSLALIRSYEQEVDIVDKRDDVVDVPQMSKERFFDTLRHAYGKIQSALEYVRQRGNADGFYVLETEQTVTSDICSDVMNDQEKLEVLSKTKGFSLEKRYEQIKELASVPPGTKSPAERDEISVYMGEYKQQRDEMRNYATEQDAKAVLRKAKKQKKYPSGLEYENAVEKKKATMRRILKAAIDADYDGTDYTKEFEAANDARDKYISGKARLEKYIRTNIACLVLVMLAMLVPYFVFQMRGSTIGAMILISVALAFFGGVFVLSAFLHVIPILRDIRSAKITMTDLHEKCLLKQRQSVYRLRKRYREYLPAIEKIHYELAELAMIYEANREINRHMEDHREMLERVRDVLVGMLTSMQIAHKADGGIALDEDEFKINEPFHQNSVYKVFTIDVIEEIFEEGRR